MTAVALQADLGVILQIHGNSLFGIIRQRCKIGASCILHSQTNGNDAFKLLIALRAGVIHNHGEESSHLVVLSKAFIQIGLIGS